MGGCSAAAMCGLLSTCVAAAAELGWQRDGNKRRRQKPWPTKGWRSVCGCAMRAPGTACEARQAMVPAAAVFATAARSESVQRRSTCLSWRCPHPPVHRFTELLIICTYLTRSPSSRTSWRRRHLDATSTHTLNVWLVLAHAPARLLHRVLRADALGVLIPGAVLEGTVPACGSGRPGRRWLAIAPLGSALLRLPLPRLCLSWTARDVGWLRLTHGARWIWW